MMRIATYSDDLLDAVKSLWEAAYPEDPPWNRAEAVIAAKVAVDRNLLPVELDDQGTVVGVALGGYDGHRGWLYSVTVAPTWPHRGVGTQLVENIESTLRSRGCAKINVEVMLMEVAFLRFYHDRGFTVSERVIMSKRLE